MGSTSTKAALMKQMDKISVYNFLLFLTLFIVSGTHAKHGAQKVMPILPIPCSVV